MSAAFWSSLLTLRDRVDQHVLVMGRRLAEQRRSAEPEAPDSGTKLRRLRSDIQQELEHWYGLSLMPASERFGAHADDARCQRLVAFWVNERACSRLDPADQGDFSPVGPAGVELSAGGVLFFDDLEELEAERLRAVTAAFSSPPRLGALEFSAELALFLLEQGFVGVYLGSAARLEPIKARLRRRQLPAVPELLPAPELEQRTRVARIALLAGLVLCFYACCAWVSAGWGGA